MAKRPNIVNVSDTPGNNITINSNFKSLQEAFDNVVTRDGSTPNTMLADLDLNNNSVLNINSIDTKTLSVDGQDISEAIESTLDAAERAEIAASKAEESEQEAEAYAINAGNSAVWALSYAGDAEDARDLAEGYRDQAANSASNAEDYRDVALQAKEDAETAQGLAENAQVAAETAKGLAEDAKDDAEAAALIATSAAGPLEGGNTGQVLRKQSGTDYDYEWATISGTGDMTEAVYDPQGIADDAFDLANMTGTLPPSQITPDSGSGMKVVGRTANTGAYGHVSVAGLATGSTIPIREASGTLQVATPTSNAHAATKAYVDGLVPTWTTLSGKPTSFPPSAHTHTTSDITGLGSLATVTPTGTPSSNTVLYGDSTWGASPAAIASGAIGAPKVRGEALNIFLGAVNITGNAGQGWVGLDRLNLLLLRMWGPAPTASGSYTLRVRFTGDNGATWGSWQTLRTGISNGSVFIADMRLNLDTGEYGLIRAADTTPTGVLTVPPNCNGIQISWNFNSPADMMCDAWAMGGRA